MSAPLFPSSGSAGTRREVTKDALTAMVVLTVTLVWGVVFLASIYTREYTPLIYVSGPMLGIVGYVTGTKIIRQKGGPDG